MLHDPQVYPEPSKFNPERFLGSQPQQDPRNVSFGFGRRYVCFPFFLLSRKLLIYEFIIIIIGFVLVSPGSLLTVDRAFNCSLLQNNNNDIIGRVLADSSLFISCAMSLAVFDISKYSKDGVVVEPVVEQKTGTIR